MIIRVDDLHISFDGRPALAGVSLAIAPATVTALIGPNGAGKTTLMRAIAGVDQGAAGYEGRGRVEVAGIDVRATPRLAHRRIGYLQDLFGLFDDLTVRQCLGYHARAQGVPAELRSPRIEETARLLGLADRLDVKARHLSRGQRQRLAVGQAVIHRPAVLLLDEPTAGLDPEARLDLAAMIRTLRQEGLTLVVSSHILVEIESWSTDVLVLRSGQIVDHGAIDRFHDAVARRLTVQLAAPHPGLGETLASWPGVGTLVEEPLSVAFDFSGDAEAQAALLRRLVLSDVPVAGFSAERPSVQATYLRKVAS